MSPCDHVAFLADATRLNIDIRCDALIFTSNPVSGETYDMVIACICEDLVLYMKPDGKLKRCYGICEMHDLLDCGILLKPKSEPDYRRAEARRASGYTTDRWHRARRNSPSSAGGGQR